MKWESPSFREGSSQGEMKITEVGYPQPLFTTKGSLRVAEIFTSEGVV